MDKETAKVLARSYLAGSIEIKEIPKEAVEGLPLYCCGDRSDFYFFYFHGPMAPLCVGGSKCVAISKKTGAVEYMGTIGE